MTSEEIDKLLDVVATADGGCTCCVEGLLEMLAGAFPRVDWRERFGPVTSDNVYTRQRRAWGRAE